MIKQFYPIIAAIVVLPIIYNVGLPNWMLLIPTVYLAWEFITRSWYAIKRTFFNKD